MYPGYGGPRSFCCPSECYQFSSCYGVVNQPSASCSAPITSSTSCDPCGGEQKLCARQNPSYIKFSAMPSQPISIAAGTSNSANTKLQRKPSKPVKRNAMKCNKENISAICKSGPNEIASKGDVSLMCETVKAQGSNSKIYAGVCTVPSTTGNDKLPMQISTNDITGNISKVSSCGSGRSNVITKTSSDDIFDVITDDNVILRCQCHCDCQKAHQPFNINHHSCSRNRDQLNMPFSGICRSVKVNGLSASHCSWRIPEQQFEVKISDTNLASVGKSNCNTFNRNRGPTSNNSPPQFHKYSSKSGPRLQNDPQMEVIDEECECEECTCKNNYQSMTATPPSKHHLNQRDFIPFADDYQGKSSKPIEETCIDFLNIICDNILESVENSFNEILHGSFHQMLTKMDEMQSKLDRNETMMSRLYCGIMEKMAEQNENSLRQFRKMLEFLMEKGPNGENQRQSRNCQNNNPTNCSNKGCQCDLYKMESLSPTHNNLGKSPKYSCFDVKGHDFINTKNRELEKGNRSWNSRNTNRTEMRRCICCNSEMKQQNRANNSQATGGSCSSRQRSVGGANDTIRNFQKTVSLPETKNPHTQPIDFTHTHDYFDRNSSDEKGESRPSSNCRVSQPYLFDRLSTDFPTNSSEQISDANNCCSGRENSSTSLAANKTHGTVRILGQCNNSLQTTRTDDNDTSGYATEPEDNANDEIMYAGDNRKKLSFTKSKNDASPSETLGSDKPDFMAERE